jgi:hypothetical protein
MAGGGLDLSLVGWAELIGDELRAESVDEIVDCEQCVLRL